MPEKPTFNPYWFAAATNSPRDPLYEVRKQRERAVELNEDWPSLLDERKTMDLFTAIAVIGKAWAESLEDDDSEKLAVGFALGRARTVKASEGVFIPFDTENGIQLAYRACLDNDIRVELIGTDADGAPIIDHEDLRSKIETTAHFKPYEPTLSGPRSRLSCLTRWSKDRALKFVAENCLKGKIERSVATSVILGMDADTARAGATEFALRQVNAELIALLDVLGRNPFDKHDRVDIRELLHAIDGVFDYQAWRGFEALEAMEKDGEGDSEAIEMSNTPTRPIEMIRVGDLVSMVAAELTFHGEGAIRQAIDRACKAGDITHLSHGKLERRTALKWMRGYIDKTSRKTDEGLKRNRSSFGL